MRFSFKSFAIGFGCAALSLGAVTYANAAGDANIKACANKTSGAMRYISKGKCKKSETTLSWNQTGLQGLPGAAGAAGAVGAKGDAGTNGTNGVNTNSQVKNLCGDNGTTACAIGLKGPSGGIVFMTPSTLGNTTGLFYEAAPSTWSSPSGDPTSAWCSNTTDLLGVASALVATGAMDGAAKAAVMLGACTSGAANLADAYTSTVNGVVYGDWFLPSQGELNQMHLHRNTIGGFAPSFYWSSSESRAGSAWFWHFGSGYQDDGGAKIYDFFFVRPVRVF